MDWKSNVLENSITPKRQSQSGQVGFRAVVSDDLFLSTCEPHLDGRSL